jgi:hypothetical protein
LPVPTWVPGQVLSASDVNTWFVPLAVVKGADTARTTTTTLANDPDLVLAVAATSTYRFECWVRYTAAAGGDLKFQWTAPAGAALKYSSLHNEGGGTGFNNSDVVYALPDVVFIIGAGTGSERAFHMFGTLNIAGTAGNLQFQWAQNTSSASATTVKQYSRLVLERIA